MQNYFVVLKSIMMLSIFSRVNGRKSWMALLLSQSTTLNKTETPQ